jgi:hypothetical protein
VIHWRITFTPTGSGSTFKAPARVHKLSAGIAAPRPAWAPEGQVRGTEHTRPGDTPDEDYGQLLDRTTQRGKCAGPPSQRSLPKAARHTAWRPGAHSQAESLDELNANLREVIAMLLEDGDQVQEAEFVGIQTVRVA